MGAAPRHVLWLLVGEGTLVTALGALIGSILAFLLVALAGPWIQARFGVTLQLSAPSAAQWAYLGGVMAAGVLASLVPALRAYQLSLADGLTQRT